MGLFGKKKDEDDMKQTSGIKEASSTAKKEESPAPVPATPELQSNPTDNSTPMNNPFKTENASAQSSNDISPPLISEHDFSDMPGSMNPTPAAPSTPPTPDINPSAPMQSSVPMSNITETATSREDIEEMVDEVVEKVIEERWKEIVEKIDKVVAWKDKQEAHVNMIKEDVVVMQETFKELEKRLINKIGSYDKSILDVNSEIKALEKVFQKVTPTLVDNVNALAKITRELKGGKDIEVEETSKEDSKKSSS